MQQEYTWDTAAIATPDTLLTTSAEVKSLSGVDTSELPGILKKIYEKMKDRRGEFDSDFFASIDIGLRDIDLKYVQFTVSNLRSVVLDTGDYQKAKDPYKTVISLQGYASIAILDRFWGSCLLIGREKEYYLSELADMLDLIKESEEDREKRKNQELEAVRMEPTYSPSPANDPINDAEL